MLRERFGKRELERHLDSSYFERTLLADQKRSPVVSVLPQDSTNVLVSGSLTATCASPMKIRPSAYYFA